MGYDGTVKVTVVQLPPTQVIKICHVGPYDQLGPIFGKLWGWIENTGVQASRSIGIYYDNPDITPAKELRSAACAEVAIGFQLGDTGGLPIEIDQIRAGDYAMTRHTGPYESLEPVWTEFTAYIENSLRRTISESSPAFEVYVNDPAEVAPSALITDLFMPLD